MLFEIFSNHLAAVQASCAIEGDRRPELEYAHIDVEKKMLVGTDGIIMTVVPIQNLRETHKGFINFRPIPLVRTLQPYVVSIDTDQSKATFRAKTFYLTGKSAQYPDWKKAWDAEFIPTDHFRIALNPRPLERIARSISTKNHEVIIAMEFGVEASDPVKISYSGDENVKIKSIFMLCVWPKEKEIATRKPRE